MRTITPEQIRQNSERIAEANKPKLDIYKFTSMAGITQIAVAESHKQAYDIFKAKEDDYISGRPTNACYVDHDNKPSSRGVFLFWFAPIVVIGVTALSWLFTLAV